MLDPQTGAVFAMASSPTLRPEPDREHGGYAQIQATQAPCHPSAPLLNRATQGLYPPGSTFKTITAAAALDDRVFTPASTFHDPGYCTVYGKPVYNALDQNGPEAFGTVDLVTAYEHSINAVFCMIGQDARREEDARGGEEVRLLLDAAARDAEGRALGVRALQPGTHRLFDPKHDYDVDAGPARVRPGADARDAAADGDGRGRRSRTAAC